MILESTTYPFTDEVLLPMFEDTGLNSMKISSLRSPGTGRSRQSAIPDSQHSESFWRSDRRFDCCRGPFIFTNSEGRSRGFVRTSCGSSEASGEHFSGREYRHGKRNGATLLRPQYRYMGSYSRRCYEAFRVHAFLSWAGIGGHCIPLDPHYLSWKARQHGFDSRFISLAEEVNSRMPEHVVQLVATV